MMFLKNNNVLLLIFDHKIRKHRFEPAYSTFSKPFKHDKIKDKKVIWGIYRPKIAQKLKQKSVCLVLLPAILPLHTHLLISQGCLFAFSKSSVAAHLLDYTRNSH